MDLDSTGDIQKYVLKEYAKNNILDLFIGWSRDRGVELDKHEKELILKLTDDLVSTYGVSRQVIAKKLEIESDGKLTTDDFVTLSEYEDMFNEFMSITTKLMIEVVGLELEIYRNSYER